MIFLRLILKLRIKSQLLKVGKFKNLTIKKIRTFIREEKIRDNISNRNAEIYIYIYMVTSFRSTKFHFEICIPNTKKSFKDV